MISGLVSAIMPTYNRCEFLIDRIPQLLNQTYTNFELIIIDDNSTDKTEEVVKSFNSNKIKYIKLDKNSKCVSIPRNIGISNSNGEFITHEDDDVYTFNNKFELLINGIENNILCYGNRYNVDSGKEEFIDIPEWNPNLNTGIDNSQILYRRNCYDNIPLVFCRRACDWNLCIRLYSIGKFKSIKEPVSKYIWHGKNRSLNRETNYIELNVDYYEKYFNSNYRKEII